MCRNFLLNSVIVVRNVFPLKVNWKKLSQIWKVKWIGFPLAFLFFICEGSHSKKGTLLYVNRR